MEPPQSNAEQAIFVYGTLKRGEEREPMWPHSPQRVEDAWTNGVLYALPRYPAMVPGDGRVGGELWFIAAERMKRTLAVLDEIEGYTGGASDLYVRSEVVAFVEDREVSALTYFYNRPRDLQDLEPIPPSSDGCSYWSAQSNA